jgi:hypothetical protein
MIRPTFESSSSKGCRDGAVVRDVDQIGANRWRETTEQGGRQAVRDGKSGRAHIQRKMAFADGNAIHTEEVVALTGEKGTVAWKGFGLMNEGWLLALTGRTSEAIHTLTSGIEAWRSHTIRARLPVLFGEGLCRTRPIG